VDLPGKIGEDWEFVLRTKCDASPGALVGLFSAPVLIRRDIPKPADIVLITADTLRADHIMANREALGLGPLTGLSTPFIDSLAKRGTNYVNAMATCNSTNPSHASILTGLFVRDHQVSSNNLKLAEEAITIPELIRDQYFCVAGVTARHLNSSTSGLGQGFDVSFEVPRGKSRVTMTRPTTIEALQSVQMDNYLQHSAGFLDVQLTRFLQDAGELPLFLWLHFFDPHTPYVIRDEIAEEFMPPKTPDGPPVLEQLAIARAARDGLTLTHDELITSFLVDSTHLSFAGEYHSIDRLIAAYAAGITQFDRDLSSVFDSIMADGRDPYVLFTADHGESLGERDIWFDHGGAYGNTLRVPFILAGPGIESDRVVHAPVSTIDLMPTILGLTGTSAPSYLTGADLLSGGEPEADRRRWFQHSNNLSVGYNESGRHTFVVTRDHEIGVFKVPFKGDQVSLEFEGQLLETTPEQDAAIGLEIHDWIMSPVVELQSLRADLRESDKAELRALGYTDE